MLLDQCEQNYLTGFCSTHAGCVCVKLVYFVNTITSKRHRTSEHRIIPMLCVLVASITSWNEIKVDDGDHV